MSSKTNVWGVGTVINCLMSLDGVPYQPDWLGDPIADMAITQDEAKTEYSDDLHRLTGQCLQPDPALRPTFRELIRDVETCIREGVGQPDLAEGMRRNGPGQGNQNNRLNLRNDGYAIGLAFNTLG